MTLLHVASLAHPWTNSKPSELPATEGFVSALTEVGGSLVLASRQNSVILAICAEEQRCVASYLPIPLPMGLAAREGSLAVGYGDGVAVLGQIDTLQHGAVFVPVKRHICGPVGIHDVWWGDEVLFLNSWFSAICSLQNHAQFRIEWRPHFCGPLNGDDCCHLNGMALKADRTGFVTALGSKPGFESWRADAPLGGILMDLQGNILMTDLALPHSPILVGERVWFAESAFGRVRSVDPNGGGSDLIFETNHFIRGIATKGPYLFLGLSRVRQTAENWANAAPRELNDLPMGRILAVLASSREVLGWADLPGIDEVSSLIHVTERVSFAWPTPEAVKKTIVFET